MIFVQWHLANKLSRYILHHPIMSFNIHRNIVIQLSRSQQYPLHSIQTNRHLLSRVVVIVKAHQHRELFLLLSHHWGTSFLPSAYPLRRQRSENLQLLGPLKSGAVRDAQNLKRVPLLGSTLYSLLSTSTRLTKLTHPPSELHITIHFPRAEESYQVKISDAGKL